MLSEKRALVRNTLFNGVSQSAAMVAAFVFMPMLVRAFGIVDFGLYVLISAVSSYAALLDLGVGTALTKQIAEAEATADNELAERGISTAFVFYLVAGLIAAAVMAVLGVLAPTLFQVSSRGATLLAQMLWIVAAFQLLQWPASTGRHVLAGMQRYDVIAVAGLVGTVLNIASVLFVLASGAGPVVLVALNSAALAASALIMAVMAVVLSRPRRLRLSAASTPALRVMLGFGWSVFVIQLSDVLFYQQTDRLILGVLAGAVAVGLYEASAKVNALITYLSGLSVSAIVPAASSMGATGRDSSLRSLFVRGSKYGAALIAPITVLVVVFSERLVVLWLGDRFAGQGIVMQVLVFPHIVVSIGLMGDAIAISRGRMGRRVPFIVAQAVLNVVLSVLLVQRYGVIGVAIATAAAHLLDFPIHVRFLLQEAQMSLKAWLREVIVPVYPLLLVPAGLGVAFSRTVLADSLPGIAVATLLGLAAYWALFYLVGLSRPEREDVAAVVKSLGHSS